jgi:GNAT superfamily N-acetyltransferase
MIREALLKASDLDADGAARLLKYVDAADRHPEFAGYDLVKGPERDSARLAITDDSGVVVGFMTPRFDRGFWRTGAIYTDPAARGKGYARRAIIDFFKGPAHRPARVWIAENNEESQRAFTRAGFVRGERRDLGPSPSDKGHDYYLDTPLLAAASQIKGDNDVRITESLLRQIIREEARRVLHEGDNTQVLYTGIVLDDRAVESLRDKIDDLGFGSDVEGWETSNIAAHGNEQLNHHMTVTVGSLKPDSPLRADIDKRFTLRVVGWGVDPVLGVAAWQVEPPSGIPVKTGNPHITAALRDSGVKPFLASKIKNWTPIDEPFAIAGTLREVTPRS